jgi:hypothetical protein
MFPGLVDRQWARPHYRRWYDETFGAAAGEARAPEEGDGPAAATAGLPFPGPNEPRSVVAGADPDDAALVPARPPRPTGPGSGRTASPLSWPVPRLIDIKE